MKAHNNYLLRLLKIIGSPLVSNEARVSKELRGSYDQRLFSIAEANKIPLAYLNTVASEERQKLPEFNYHLSRFYRLMEITVDISKLFEEEGLDYIVFKTLRPYPEYVADIDILNLGPHKDYEKMIEILRCRGYVLMERERGGYCTTFRGHKTRFKTEIMIDVYDQISVGYLIYLDKRKLRDYIVEKELQNGGKVKVFAPEAELITIIAHSTIKENMYTLAEYYATLHYLAQMDQNSIERLTNLIRENRLMNAFRWHLTITAVLHKLAHGFIPEKIVHLLFRLGGPLSKVQSQVSKSNPPYKCDPITLVSIFKEKLRDDIFRRSLCLQVLTFPTKRFTRRLLTRIRNLVY